MKKFWLTTKFRRLTAGLSLLACFQFNMLVNGIYVAVFDIVVTSTLVIIAIILLSKRKRKKLRIFQ